MADQPGEKRPHAVLFLCGQNSIRSPMAAAIAKHYFGKSIYVQSAGIRAGERDAFATRLGAGSSSARRAPGARAASRARVSVTTGPPRVA